MPWQKKDPRPFRDCVICGEQFDRAERGWSAITCGDECARLRLIRVSTVYQREHPEQNRAAVARYKAKKKAERAPCG